MSIPWRASLVIIATLAVPVVPFVAIGELPGDRWLSAADDDAVEFGLIGSSLLAADVLLPIPSSVLGTLLGARLGWALGFLWTFAGLAVGHLAGYAIGRLTLNRLGAELPAAPTLVAVFVSRPVPVLAEAMTLTAGAARAPFTPFVVAVAAGDALYAAALTASAAAWLPTSWVGPGLIVPLALPAVAWLLWRARRGNDRTRARSDGRA
jgi:membrane protein YqaA with SNARE-associated domain